MILPMAGLVVRTHARWLRTIEKGTMEQQGAEQAVQNRMDHASRATQIARLLTHARNV